MNFHKKCFHMTENMVFNLLLISYFSSFIPIRIAVWELSILSFLLRKVFVFAPVSGLNSGTQSLKIPSKSRSLELNVTHPPSKAIRG